MSEQERLHQFISGLNFLQEETGIVLVSVNREQMEVCTKEEYEKRAEVEQTLKLIEREGILFGYKL